MILLMAPFHAEHEIDDRADAAFFQGACQFSGEIAVDAGMHGSQFGGIVRVTRPALGEIAEHLHARFVEHPCRIPGIEIPINIFESPEMCVDVHEPVCAGEPAGRGAQSRP